MNLLKANSVKYKLLSFNELVISLDRLSRFKFPEYSFFRVFSDILSKCLISPKYSKEEIEALDRKYIAQLVEEIWNKSVETTCKASVSNDIPLTVLKLTIEKTFRNISKDTQILINTDLNISPILEQLDYDSAVINLKFLIKSNQVLSKKKELTFSDITEMREKYNLCFPVEKLLIVEGITEEILLPVFADKLGHNFLKEGIYILGAGGKSKSPSLYMKIKDKLSIPIVLLFDSDAKEICTILEKQLLKKDKYILIENGEFEDILSLNLIKRTLNKEYEPASQLTVEDLRLHQRMCYNIEEFYRTRHLGEYKKSKVAKLLAENIKYENDITEETKKILSLIL